MASPLRVIRPLAPFATASDESRPILAQQSSEQPTQPDQPARSAQAPRQADPLVVSPFGIVALAYQRLSPEVIAECWERENEKPLVPGEMRRHTSIVANTTKNSTERFVRP
jgi:hypothetical protein